MDYAGYELNSMAEDKNKIKKTEPRIPSGFFELLPEDQILFNKIIDTIKNEYEKFGFAPIETPAIELAEVLLAKGGGETEKQVYCFEKGSANLCLHYDLTVPLARYAAQHYNDLTFPFRRYQIQKVWRGETAQKGRYREFYQSDIDIIGSKSFGADAELPAIIYSIFTALGFSDFTIKINNRKILNGFLESLDLGNDSAKILGAIDKLEKQGFDAVKNFLQESGISEEKIERIFEFVKTDGSPAEVISKLKSNGIKNKIFEEGMEELEKVSNMVKAFGVPETNFSLDIKIARGLDYYTGTVYETALDKYPQLGSVCSGGRYDNLVKYYIDRDLPGVGVSIGLTRLFYQLKEAGLMKPEKKTPTNVLIVPADSSAANRCFEFAAFLRKIGINTEIYLEEEKMAKQLKYADKLGIPYVAIIGEKEIAEKKITLKNMQTGEQFFLSQEEAVKIIQK